MRAFLVPRRLRVAGVVLLAIVAVGSALGGSVARSQAGTGTPLCVQHPSMCTELANPWTWHGYTYNSGHDEPAVLFYSNHPGSGNSDVYHLTLPTDPATPPSQSGTGGTWNFQLHPAFWFGMAMCDDQDAPNPGVNCPADSDKNIKTGTDPSSRDYIGLTPGTAFMEMQFYPPGWGPISCTDANGNQDGKWCSALTIDSVQSNSNTGAGNNPACNNLVGPEPVNYAIVTKNGVPVAPPRPDTPFSHQAVVTSNTLEYNNGDQLVVDMHDTSGGFQVTINDLTTGQSGSMTASAANGFGHALFQPGASTCTMVNYTYHPMFSTSGPNTRVLWAAHAFNVGFSDEVGHFEYCNAATSSFRCDPATGYPNPSDPAPDGGPLNDDIACFPAPVVGPAGNTLVPSFTGCDVGPADDDFDGPPYQASSWPGTAAAVPGLVSTPIRFTSPLFGGGKGEGRGGLHNYDQVAFESDLPRIEGSDSSPNNDCQRHVSNPSDPAPGSGCVNPPNGATFYPIYSTTTAADGSCLWQEGGGAIPGTTNNFGGTSAAEYGGLLLSNYPAAGFTVTQRFNNFHRDLANNPCPAP